MGSFTMGFVLPRAAEWSKLSGLSDPHGWRVFKHRSRDLWMLEFWSARRGKPSQPFTCRDQPKVAAAGQPRLDVSLQNVFNTLRMAGYALYCSPWLDLAPEVAARLNTPVFLFATDDDECDFACTAEPGRIRRMRVRLDNLEITAVEGRVRVTPIVSDEDDDETGGPWGRELEAAVTALPNVTVGPVRNLTGGMPLAGVVLAEWPKALGDPEEILGLGTWDAFATFGELFQVVAERAELPISTDAPMAGAPPSPQTGALASQRNDAPTLPKVGTAPPTSPKVGAQTPPRTGNAPGKPVKRLPPGATGGDISGRHVTLPADCSPDFGSACLECQTTVAVERVPWMAYSLSALPGVLRLFHHDGSLFDVPLCAACQRRVTPRKLIREVPPILAGIAAAVTAAKFVDWKRLEPPTPGLLALGGVCGLIAFYLIWRSLFRGPIEISEAGEVTLYSFASAAQAIEFARRNGVSATSTMT